MSNSYFQFKQFRVEQGRCAMKVTTDACIQGAWTPILPTVKHVLDIGTGTGLLSLMLAQKGLSLVIDAVEYDRDAATQAWENFRLSVWGDRLHVFEGDIRNVILPRKYDLIISNPPFFNGSLLSSVEQRNMARHTSLLSYKDLADAIIGNLAVHGYASVLLPVNEYSAFRLQASDVGLFEYHRLQIRHTAGATVKRIVGLFSLKLIGNVEEETLAIKDLDSNYTSEFINLLGPFYLDL